MMKILKNLFNFNKKKLNNEQYMRELMPVLIKYVDLFSQHSNNTVITKWGSWTVLAETKDFKVKLITINPGHRFSLQYHNNRDELWSIISGVGNITIAKTNFVANVGDEIYVPAKVEHRVKCTSSDCLKFIEIQFGKCSEEDIVRIEDDYGR